MSRKEFRSVPVRGLHSAIHSDPTTDHDADGAGAGDSEVAEIHADAAMSVSDSVPTVTLPNIEQRLRGISPKARTHVVVNLENFEAVLLDEGRQIPKSIFNSPRSLAVCAEFGVHASELIPRAPQEFLAPNVPETIAAMRYHHFETRRQQKLGALRRTRSDRIEKSIRETIESVGNPPQVEREHSSADGAQQSVPNSQSTTAHSKPTAIALPKNRPVLPGAARISSAGAIGRPENDPKLHERVARRELAYERAIKNRLEKDQMVIQRQLMKEQRAAAHRHACEADKLRVIELRRLRWSDAKENIERKKRQDEYLSAQKQNSGNVSSCSPTPFQRSASSTSQRSNGKWSVAIAKEAYFTPRQREEKRRASSATR